MIVGLLSPALPRSRARRGPVPPRAGRGARATLAGGALPLLVACLAGPATAQPRPETGPGRPYERLVGDDWRGYSGLAQLRARDYFWWPHEGDVYRYVHLVPDATFGQVVRITQPVSCCTDAPTPHLLERLPEPVPRMWLRWRMRFSPGWTTAGPYPAGYANSYKIASWAWRDHDSRAEVGFTHTDDYYVAISVLGRDGRYRRYTKTPLPGTAADLGEVAREWSDGEWYEFVVHYEKTGPQSARQRWWKRRLTADGAVRPGPWAFVGVELTGAPTPLVDRVELGMNKNKNTPREQFIDWGPWEVVDGTRHPDPFGLGAAP